MAANYTVGEVFDFLDAEAFGLSESDSSEQEGQGVFSYLGGVASETEEVEAWTRAVSRDTTSVSRPSLPNLDPYVGSDVSGFEAVDSSGGDNMVEEFPGEYLCKKLGKSW